MGVRIFLRGKQTNLKPNPCAFTRRYERFLPVKKSVMFSLGASPFVAVPLTCNNVINALPHCTQEQNRSYYYEMYDFTAKHYSSLDGAAEL